MVNVKADSPFMASLAQAWQHLHDEEVADCNQFAQHLDSAAAGMIGSSGTTLQQVGTQVQAIANTAGTHMGSIGTAHTQANAHLVGGDESGQNMLNAVAGLTG
jgi:hypothetical protein